MRAYSSIPAGIFKTDVKKLSVCTFRGHRQEFRACLRRRVPRRKLETIESAYNDAATAVLALLISAMVSLLYKHKIKKTKNSTENKDYT